MATNPFALIFVLPSLHAWLWLPQVRYRRSGFARRRAGHRPRRAAPPPRSVRLALRARRGRALVRRRLVALGYVPLPSFLIGLAWLAAGGQLAALSAGGTRPYLSARERPPRGPIREVVRRLLSAALGRGRERRKAARASRQVPDRAPLELLLAGRNEDERVRAGGTRDHVRVLALTGLELDLAATRPATRTDELRSRAGRTHASGQPAELEARSGSAAP